MNVLFVENDDSFSFNVVDLVPGTVTLVRGAPSEVQLVACDAVVIGPGPTDPVRAGLVEVVRQVCARRIPLLGVCLGHQAIGLAFGAQLIRSAPTHGHTGVMQVGSSRYLATGPFEVMRYHSLSLTDVRAPLAVVGSLADGTVMAVEHQTLPVLGLQFHPDSYATPAGRVMVERFFERAR